MAPGTYLGQICCEWAGACLWGCLAAVGPGPAPSGQSRTEPSWALQQQQQQQQHLRLPLERTK
eukprot:2718848-Alexandrium_andersonii.AAC.1